jgi:sulfonate transport system permease protein
VLLGFAIGAALGLVVGSLVGLSRAGETLLAPTVGALRAVPSLAWIPLLIIWLQIGEDSKITLVAIGAFFPVYTTVASALRHVDPHLVEAGRAFGLRGARLLAQVQLPAATPGVVAGLRLALAQSWLFLVAAELLGASMGLGFLLTDSQNNGRVDRILLAIVLLAVLGKATDALIGLAERRLLSRW